MFSLVRRSLFLAKNSSRKYSTNTLKIKNDSNKNKLKLSSLYFGIALSSVISYSLINNRKNKIEEISIKQLFFLILYL